jgi:T5SS/PEP-CTERM-associated repeat protein
LWGTAGNWNPVGGPPGVGDTGNFNLPNTYTVQLTGGTTHVADGAVIRDGVVTLESNSTSLPGAINVTSGSADFEVLSGSVVIGSAGRPVTLTVGDNFTTGNIASTTVTANSDVTAADLPIGTSASSDSTLRVTGAGSTVTITGSFAAVAGFGGKAALVIENGATATLSGPIVTQVAFSLNADNTHGTVEVLTGGVLTTRSLSIGSAAGGKLATLLVKDSNSTVTQTGNSTLAVGNLTNDEMIADVTVADSAVFNSGTGGMVFNNTGTLNVVNSGTFNANGSLTLNGGTAVVDGGVLNANGPLSIDGGTVSLMAGVLNSGTVGLFNGGTFDFDGGTLRVNNFNGDLVNAAGRLAPGHSAGLTTISGAYTQQTNGVLEIEIGGLTAGSQFDMLDVNGSATLGGTLQVSLINGFTPQAGNSFDILDWGSLAGTFTALQLQSPGANLMWNSLLLYASGVLRVAVAGDYNFNGVVDAGDYVVWRNTLGQIGGPLAADGNNNGQIDAGDLTVWHSHFGQPGGSGNSASANVPEPGSGLLLPLGAALVYVRRRCLCCNPFRVVGI